MTTQRFKKPVDPSFNKEAADGYYRGPKLENGASLDEVYAHFEQEIANGNVRLDWEKSPLCDRSAKLTVTIKTGREHPAPAELSQDFFYTYDPNEKEWPHVIGLSTQVGCTYACQFCGSAGNLLKANLVEEQFAYITHILAKRANLQPGERARVNMTGEGDPGANMRHVIPFLQYVQHINPQIERVMVSTAGNLRAIEAFIIAVDKYDLPQGFLELQSSVHLLNPEREKVVILPAGVDVEEFVAISKILAEKAGTLGRINIVVMPDWNTDERHAQFLANLSDKHFYVTLVQLNPAEATEKMRKDAPPGALEGTEQDVLNFKAYIVSLLPDGSTLIIEAKKDRAAELFGIGCGQLTSDLAEESAAEKAYYAAGASNSHYLELVQ